MTVEELKKMRKDARIPGYLLGKKMGISQSTISAYERGALEVPDGKLREWEKALRAVIRDEAGKLRAVAGAAR